MPKVTFNKRFGRYRTGDAASLSRAHARVLTASGHVTPYIEKRPKPAAQSASAAKPAAAVDITNPVAIPVVHEEVRHAHHETTTEAPIPAKAAPKAAPVKGAGSKVDK